MATLRARAPRPTEQAADAIHSAAIHLLRSLRRQDARLGVGPAGLSVLSVLVFGGPKTIGQLAEIEQVRKATMSRIVKSLERWGMVQKLGGTDRRSIVVHATPTGRTVMRRGRANRLAVLEQRLERLHESDIALLVRAAQLIARVSKAEALA
jgi:DNA-binding MarR family transcriptional regulator